MKPSYYLSLLAGLSINATAQSLGSIEPAAEAPADAGSPSTEDASAAVAPPLIPKADPELINEPSRYAGIDVEAYIHTVSSTFSMRTRERDPFARHQDPSYKPPVPKPKIGKRPAPRPVRVTPFSDIVEAIRITTIIPSQQKFLVDGRSFRTGDEIKLKTGDGKLIAVEVVAVHADSVKFRHGTTKETAIQSLKLLPGGMERGGGGIMPRGITSPDEQAPIDISGSGAGTSLSSSR